jgi:hypothetical protein
MEASGIIAGSTNARKHILILWGFDVSDGDLCQTFKTDTPIRNNSFI